MIELGKAGGHFPASRTGSRYHHQRPFCLDIVVFSKAVVADDQGDIAGIAVDGVVAVYTDPHFFQLCLKLEDGRLVGVVGDDYASHIEPPVRKGVDEPQNVHIVGDAQIVADLVFRDIGGADGNDDLRLIGKLHQHPQLTVGLKTRKHPGGMVVVKKLSTEFQVQFISKLADPLTDVIGLHGQIFVVVKS